jgi:hypothetical protein
MTTRATICQFPTMTARATLSARFPQ